MKKKPEPSIPSDNSILMFLHCRKCLKELPQGMSPREWAQLEVGWTKVGIQVWCRRHETNVMHMHFEGQKHYANSLPTKKPDEQGLSA